MRLLSAPSGAVALLRSRGYHIVDAEDAGCTVSVRPHAPDRLLLLNPSREDMCFMPIGALTVNQWW